MSDVKDADDRKRAAALAEFMKTSVWWGDFFPDRNRTKGMRDLLIRALHAYAAAPAVSADLRERVGRAIREAPMRRTLNGPRIIDPTIELTENELLNADAALSAISAAGYVIRPREPTEAMIEAAVRAGMIDLSKPGKIPTLHEQAAAMIRAALAAGTTEY